MKTVSLDTGHKELLKFNPIDPSLGFSSQFLPKFIVCVYVWLMSEGRKAKCIFEVCVCGFRG